MINGKKINLQKVERDSIEKLRSWRNDPSLKRYFREHRDISKEDQLKWYEDKVLNDRSQYNFEIREASNGKLIGHCGLYYINWISRTAEFGIYIGDFDYRNGGYGSDSLRTLLRYGFNDLNMNKIWGEVYDNNKAIKIYRHIGFKDEGTLRDNYYNEGRYWDSHIISILKKEYEDMYSE